MIDCSYGIWADGGCPNGGTQRAHGHASFLLESRKGRKQIVRLTDPPGVTTNNEAEYVALISAH